MSELRTYFVTKKSNYSETTLWETQQELERLAASSLPWYQPTTLWIPKLSTYWKCTGFKIQSFVHFIAKYLFSNWNQTMASLVFFHPLFLFSIQKLGSFQLDSVSVLIMPSKETLTWGSRCLFTHIRPSSDRTTRQAFWLILQKNPPNSNIR